MTETPGGEEKPTLGWGEADASFPNSLQAGGNSLCRSDIDPGGVGGHVGWSEAAKPALGQGWDTLKPKRVEFWIEASQRRHPSLGAPDASVYLKKCLSVCTTRAQTFNKLCWLDAPFLEVVLVNCREQGRL